MQSWQIIHSKIAYVSDKFSTTIIVMPPTQSNTSTISEICFQILGSIMKYRNDGGVEMFGRMSCILKPFLELFGVRIVQGKIDQLSC